MGDRAAATRAVKAVVVKNRAPAAIQITAEQLVLEARDRAMAQAPPPPKRHIADTAELAEHRLRARKEFEDRIRLNRQNMSTWLRYARWEEQQHEIERARSIYERALDMDYRHVAIWLRYAEMEMRAKFVNRARNVWDRAVSLLPRVETLWYKYTYMEEMLGNVANARALFERWMEWEPAEQAWLSYINFEGRAGATEKARAVYERYIACHPSEAAYIKFAKWEGRNSQKALARRVYERAMEELREGEVSQALYLAFAAFEEHCAEYERARVIYKYGLQRLPKGAAAALYAAHVSFEKKHGDRKGIEDVITAKRRLQYEEAVAATPLNYDAWFDYARLEEGEGDVARIREVYERAIACVPPLREKRFWRRYIYLWINYALFEETQAGDHARARAVYAAALKVVPHATFTFGKLWLLAARFEVRRLEVGAARRLLGASLGMCPKESVLRGYIDLETRLGEIDRVRRLHEKQVQLWPFNAAGWCRFAALEATVGEAERARAIYELAVSQGVLDMPEVAWKAFIDFEIEAGEAGNARALYERLLARTQHVKVWMSYAAFEASIVGSAEGARHVYRRAYEHFRGVGEEGREDRALIVETWRAFESGLVDDEAAMGAEGDVATAQAHLAAVDKLLPRRVVKRRPVLAADGSEVGSEEYVAFLFPDDEAKPASLKLLELAQRWKAAGGGSVDAVLRKGAADAAGAASTAEMASAGGFGAVFGGAGGGVGGDDTAGSGGGAAGAGAGAGAFGGHSHGPGDWQNAEAIPRGDAAHGFSGDTQETEDAGVSTAGARAGSSASDGRPGAASWLPAPTSDGAGGAPGFRGMLLRRQATGMYDAPSGDSSSFEGSGSAGPAPAADGAAAGSGVGHKRSALQAFGEQAADEGRVEAGSGGSYRAGSGLRPGGDAEQEGEIVAAGAGPAKVRRVGDAGAFAAGWGCHGEGQDSATTPVGGTSDPNALELEEGGGAATSSSETTAPPAEAEGPAVTAAGDIVQPVAAEGAADPDDPVAGMEAERELEDRVRAAASAADLPRDLYSAEERATAADRDL